MPARTFVSTLLFFAMAGCGDDEKPPDETAWGLIDAVGRSGTTSLSARYSSKLDATCVPIDARSACVLVECEPDATLAFANAGEVTVGDDALERIDDGSYSLEVPEELVPGESLVMRASGSSRVPEHSGTVVVPEPLELTSALDDPLAVDPSMDFAVTWTPAMSDRVSLALTFDDLEIRCSASAELGELTIASRLFEELPDAAAGSFTFVSENIVDSTPDDWQVWFGVHQVVAEGAVELAPGE
jgi:hypothetical protein